MLAELANHPWFEYRSRCGVCKWDGPDTQAMQRSSKPYFGCPQCKTWWVPHPTPGIPNNKSSALRSYAVHKVCGKWHKEGTECIKLVTVPC